MNRRYLSLLLFMFLSSCEKSQDENVILKFYGDTLEDIGYSVAKVNNGYAIAGQLTEVARIGGNLIDDKNSAKKMGIIKTGTDGNTIWKNSYGDRLIAGGSKILALDDGSVICTGYAIDSVSLQRDIFVVKVDAGGTGSMQKIYKNAGDQYGIDILRTQEGFLVLGSTDVVREPLTDSTGNASGKKDILLLRINNNLEPVISPAAFGFPGNDVGAAIKADINGGYIVLGTTDRSDQKPTQQAGNNIFLLRVNADGSATQPRIIGGIRDEFAADIEVLNDGYFIAGTIGSEGSIQQGYAWGISGNIYSVPVFSHEIDLEPSSSTKSSVSIKSIYRYKANSFVMAGQSVTGSLTRMLIFVTDAEGNFVEGKKKVTGGTGTQVAYDVISDDDDNIIAVGKNSYENNSMISLLKFRF
jgi:hypothetical protein